MKTLLHALILLASSITATAQCSMYAKPDPESNIALRKLCIEDQAVRMSPDVGKGAWANLGRQDAQRREAVRAMIDADELHTADDYFDAGLIFQHGDKSEDYLLSHTLALVATAKGHPGATSLAAASLDRYLHSIKQPQIYGTQFSSSGNGMPFTQEPFNRQLITDELRKQMHVELLNEQQRQLERLNKKTHMPGD